MLAKREGLVDPVMEDHLAGLTEAELEQAGARMADIERGSSGPAALQEPQDGEAAADPDAQNGEEDQP